MLKRVLLLLGLSTCTVLVGCQSLPEDRIQPNQASAKEKIDLENAAPLEKYRYIVKTGRDKSLQKIIEVLGEPTRETEGNHFWDFENGLVLSLWKRDGSFTYSGLSKSEVATKSLEESTEEATESLEESTEEIDLANADPYEKYQYLKENILVHERTLERVREILGEPSRETDQDFVWDFEDGNAIALDKFGSFGYGSSGSFQ